MKRYICEIEEYYGCIMKVSNKEIKIRLLFIEILTIPIANIRKIYSFKNTINFLKSNYIKIEYNMGTKKNKIVDIGLLCRTSFLNYISQFLEPEKIEEKENFVREK
jgi:hypothetical protein